MYFIRKFFFKKGLRNLLSNLFYKTLNSQIPLTIYLTPISINQYILTTIGIKAGLSLKIISVICLFL
jgi:hypothetical protein